MRHEDIKVEKLIRYAQLLDLGVVSRRLGYLLEVYALATAGDLRRLSSGLTRTYHLLDPMLTKSGPYFARWRLQLNVPKVELEAIRRS